MPLGNGLKDSLDKYLSTLDRIESVVDNQLVTGPVMIFGDINTSLTQQSSLMNNWYKSHPFSKRSYIMFDFLQEVI